MKYYPVQNHRVLHSSFIGVLGQQYILWLISAGIIAILMLLWNIILQRKFFRKRRFLLQYSEKYNAIFNATNDAILLLDINGSIVEVNETTLKISGYTEQELLGQDMTVLCNTEDYNEATQILSGINGAIKGIPKNLHFQIKSKANKVYYMDVSLNLVCYMGISYILVIMRDITTFKKVVNDLEESENKFRVLAETVPLGILVYQDDRWVYANPAAETISGYSQEELFNIQIWDFVHPDYVDHVKERAQKRQKGEQAPTDYEFKIITKQGTEKWIYLSGNTIEFKGKPAGIIGSFDITPRKYAEKEILYRQNFLEAILSAVPMPFFSKDIQGRYLFVNQAFAEYLGMSPQEVQGKTTEQCWPQKAAKNFQEVDYELKNITNVSFSDQEYLVPHSKKGERYCYISKACFCNADGDLAGLVGAFLDVTELKKTEKALRENEERYRTVFENTGTCTLIVDEDTSIIKANREIEEVTGYERKDIEGHSFTEFLVPEDINTVLDYHYRRSYSATNSEYRPPTKYTIRIYDKNKNIKTVINSVVKLPESNKRVVSFLDITEQTRLEKQLRESQKMEAVGRLAGGVAHEFNNLLQGLSGNIELLLTNKELSDYNRNYVQELERITSRAKYVVKQLLTLGRKESGSFQVQNLNTIIIDLIDFLKKTISKHVELNTDLSPNLSLINADRTQIEQVLINLVNNACDAISLETNGKIDIITRDELLEDKTNTDHCPERFVTLCITDSGRGMDKDTREQIFEPFYTTKEINQGTGLGLATVYGIVQSHNGIITCNSEEGKGTSFYIYFPALGDHAVKTGEEFNSLDISWDGLKGDKTVLVVDDEEMLTDLVKDILEQSGYTVYTAHDGEKAIETYKKDWAKIDLVIVDLGMPGMSGDICIEKLREFDPWVKVIIVTGYATSEVEQNPVNYGADEFLKKPYQGRKLLENISKVLSK